jgi:pimeloyl-ACP methyl ester carboxylesterase
LTVTVMIGSKSMIPFVLVHGGGFDSRCWDRLVPHLDGKVLAVDLPGRGAHPAPMESVTFEGCAISVRDDIDAAGFEEIVLVGHSLAGCAMPSIIGLLGERVRHAVFVACTVPEDGHSAYDTLDPEIQAMIRAAGPVPDPRPMDPALAKIVFGNDLDDEQFVWCADRLVPEALRLTTDRVQLSPLSSPIPRSWVRTLQDVIISPEQQLGFANNVGNCPIADIDAGHMAMIGQPQRLAEILCELVRDTG